MVRNVVQKDQKNNCIIKDVYGMFWNVYWSQHANQLAHPVFTTL